MNPEVTSRNSPETPRPELRPTARVYTAARPISAERPPLNPTRWDMNVMVIGGGALLALSLIFGWRDLNIAPQFLLAALAVGLAALSVTRLTEKVPMLVPASVLALGTMGGLWYLASKHELLLVGLAAILGASIVSVIKARGTTPVTQPERVQAMVLWYGFTIALVACTGAFYFHYLTTGVAQAFDARRILISMAWLLTGVGMVVYARKKGSTAIRDAGFVMLAIAVGKVALYDTLQLQGMLRVLALALSGGSLLGGAYLGSKLPAQKVS